MLKKYFIIVAVSLLLTGLARTLALKLHYADYKDILGALLNISSIVFAIIGAWIAIIYPKAIGKVFGDGNNVVNEISSAVRDTEYLSELVEIVLASAIVLMAVLSIQFVYPMIKVMEQLPSVLIPCKLIGFTIVTIMTLLQLHAVSRVILANYFFLNELRNKNNKNEIDRLHK